MDTKVSVNRQKKIDIVADLSEKLGKSKAIIFTNYTGVTHKQLEALKRAIKPMQAEYVVAKNSLILRALEENKIKVEDENAFAGPTGTMLIYADVVEPLKQLAKTIKEIGLLNVKLGVMENKFLTGEQVLKISTLPSREVLLAQIAAGLKSPISGLHRALIWNLQKLVMTLGAVARLPRPEPSDGGQAKNKPAVAAPTAPVAKAKNEPEPETILAETPEEKAAEETVAQVAAEPEPETILADSASEASTAKQATTEDLPASASEALQAGKAAEPSSAEATEGQATPEEPKNEPETSEGGEN